MTDLFAQLLQRSRGEDVLSPALPSRFERVADHVEPWAEVERFVSPSETPGRQAPPQRPSIHTRVAPDDQSSLQRERPPRNVVTGETNIVQPPTTPSPDTIRIFQSQRRDTETIQPLDLEAIVAAALRAREPVMGIEATHSEADGARGVDESPERAPQRATPPALPAIVAERPSAPAAAGSPRENAQALPPAIEVRIGRIEVTAGAPPAQRATLPRVPRSPAVALSLREYLARRPRS